MLLDLELEWLGAKISAHFGYEGKTAYIVTKHAKAELIGPVLFEKLGIKLVTVEADTDRFGTFSGEIERRRSQLQTALDKARLAKDLMNASLCIASEGTIGPDPTFPVLNSNIETIVFRDYTNDFLIHQTLVSREIYSFRTRLKSEGEVDEVINQLRLEDQAMIVKSSHEKIEFVQKGLKSIDDIRAAVAHAVSISGEAILEPDFRAMHSASRRENIRKCAILLAEKISSTCPSCNRPGWSGSQGSEAKACVSCGGKRTTVPLGVKFRCDGCNHIEDRNDVNSFCAAQYCLDCNP